MNDELDEPLFSTSGDIASSLISSTSACEHRLLPFLKQLPRYPPSSPFLLEPSFDVLSEPPLRPSQLADLNVSGVMASEFALCSTSKT